MKTFWMIVTFCSITHIHAVYAQEQPTPVATAPIIQTKLAGTLKQRGTRLPLANVKITIYQNENEQTVGYEQYTQADGSFLFENIAPGTWNLYAEPDGHFPLRAQETIQNNEKLETTYLIEKGVYSQFDVLVQAPRIRREVNRVSLVPAEVEKIPGAIGDPILVVRNLPSVARVPFGDGSIIVRGSSPQDTNVFLNGTKIPIAYHFGGLRSVVPAGILQNLDFYPGNFSSYYGNTTGGILDLNLKKLKPPKIGGYVDISLLDAGFYLEGPLFKNASFAVAARRSFIDFIINAAVPKDGTVNFAAAPRYYDGQFLFNWKINNNHDFKASFIGSDDQLKIIFNQPADVDPSFKQSGLSNQTQFYLTSFTHDWSIQQNLKNQIQFAFGRNVVKFGGGSQFFFDLNFYRNQLRDTLQYKHSEQLSLRAGLDIEYSNGDITVKLPNSPQEGDPVAKPPDLSKIMYAKLKNQQTWAPAIFADADWQPIRSLHIIPGFRFDYINNVRNSLKFQPRGAIRYELIPEELTLKAGVGLYYQPPSPEQLSREFGNTRLTLQEAIHYSVGAEWIPIKKWFVDTTVFYKDIESIPTKSSKLILKNNTLQPEMYSNRGKGRVVGADFLIRHEFANHFFGWIAYTISQSDRKSDAQKNWRKFDYDQTHILTALGTYSFPNNWDVGIRWRYVTGRPMTPVTGSVLDTDADKYIPVIGRINSTRIAAFHQLDIRVDKRWIFDNFTLNYYMDLQNAYNRQNADSTNYQYDYTKTTPQVGLPILFILGLKAEF